LNSSESRSQQTGHTCSPEPCSFRKSDCKADSYSVCIAELARGMPQRGVVHSVFEAAANIVFPSGLILSLNAFSSPRMPNGLQLSVFRGAFPFSVLQTGMPVLFGAQRLHIEAIACSLDLTLCSQWNPHIERPERLDMDIIRKNGEGLVALVENDQAPMDSISVFGHQKPLAGLDVLSIAHYLCGRGPGLTPSGDDILAGWMAVGWLLHGPTPTFLAACQQIIEVAKRQTHLLSQCWLSYAARGDVAEPVALLLKALTRDDEAQLNRAAKDVLALGATSGHDLVQGIMLGLEMNLP
jgi:hypothetical protein